MGRGIMLSSRDGRLEECEQGGCVFETLVENKKKPNFYVNKAFCPFFLYHSFLFLLFLYSVIFGHEKIGKTFFTKYMKYYYIICYYYIMSFSKSKLKLVKLKNSVKIFVVQNDLKAGIMSEIQRLENYQGLKNNPEFVKYVCNLIEAAFSYKKDKEKIDKKALAIDIFCSLFPDFNMVDNIARASSLIDFLHENGDINKLSVKTELKHGLLKVGNFFLKK